ncbi:hypothetical protein PIB30_104881, partial [Stylosanthes scabra]|nr:hypothetical protein [Stylosanthes scabra]
VELGFKEARPWPENAKFQFWPSFNVIMHRKVAYATLSREVPGCCRGGSCVRNFENCVHNLVWTESKSALFQCCVRSFANNFASNFSGNFLFLSPLHESFASNAFVNLSQAFFNP